MPESPKESTVTEPGVFEEQFLETLPRHDAELLRLVGQGFASALAEPEPSGTVLDPLREILDALDLSAADLLDDREQTVDRVYLFVEAYKKLAGDFMTQCLDATRTLQAKEQRLRQVLDLRTLPLRSDLPPVSAQIAGQVMPRVITSFAHAMKGMGHWVHEGGTPLGLDRQAARALLRASLPLIDTLRTQIRKDLEILRDQEELVDALHRVDGNLASAEEALEEVTGGAVAKRA